MVISLRMRRIQGDGLFVAACGFVVNALAMVDGAERVPGVGVARVRPEELLEQSPGRGQIAEAEKGDRPL
jgi:hypothetical protein